MISDPFLLICGLGSGVLIGTLLLYSAVQRYEITIFLFALSPVISAIFVAHYDTLGAYQTTTIGSYLRVCVVMLCGTAGLIKYWQIRALKATSLPLPLKLLALYGLLACLSIVWSIDPGISAIRAVALLALISFLFGCYAWLSTLDRLQRLLEALFYSIALLVVLNSLAMLFNAKIAWYRGGDRFCGIWGSPNVMGLFAMVSYPILYLKFRFGDNRGKWMSAILALLLVSMHWLTGSRATVLVTLIGIAVWFIATRHYMRLAIVALFLLLVSFLAIEYQGLDSFQRVRNGSASLLTLNGRDVFWEGTLAIIAESPWRGYGYDVGGAIWQDPRFTGEGHLWKASARNSLHNGFFNKIVSLGMIGFLIWLAAVIIPYWQSRNLPYFHLRAYILTIMTGSFILNLVESGIGNGAKAGDIPFWIAWIVSLVLLETQRTIALPEADIVDEAKWIQPEVIDDITT